MFNGRRQPSLGGTSRMKSCRRNSAPPPPKPRGGPTALAGERSEPVRLGSVTTMHALFKGEVECKMTHVRAD